MSKIFQLIKRDLSSIRGNVIALVVLVGMIVVPTFYAWFNIAGSWDPYGNTANLKVAVANSDKGFSSDILPIELNFGEHVVADLRKSTSIGYTVTTEQEAIEGVRSGEYYAAVVIPEDFSTDMMTALSSNPVKPQVKFYQNEKSNAIAQIVTNKASTAIESDIDASFAESVTTVGSGALEQLGGVLDDDKLSEVADKLDNAISRGCDTLASTASDIRGFADILSSTQGLLDSGSGSFSSSLSSTLDVSGTLQATASNVRDLGNALDGTTDSLNDALASSAGSIDSVGSAIDAALDAADKPTSDLRDALGRAADLATSNATKLSDLAAKLDNAAASASTAMDSIDAQRQALDPTAADYAIRYEALTRAYNAAASLRDQATENAKRLRTSADEMTTLATKLGEAQTNIDSVRNNTEQVRDELKSAVETAKAGIGQVQGTYEADLKGTLATLAGQISEASSGADAIVASLDDTLGSVGSTASAAASTLGDATSSLNSTADALEKAAGQLSNLHTSLRAALDSDDLQQVRDILTANPTSLAEFISSPVSVDRTPLYAIENNGSAMAPFYTTLAIWIGGVVLAALVKTNPSEKIAEELGLNPTQGYLARLFLFALVGLLQSSLICAGDLYFLGTQCANPLLFFVACWVASFTFVNIIYALTASFGDVGKAIAVVLMVIQVAGSGGTFPVQMLPQAFQAIYPFLPFVHAENAMRAAMFGLYGNDFWTCLGTLALFIIPSLLLGLVLRRPIIHLNEWVEKKLESTKIM